MPSAYTRTQAIIESPFIFPCIDNTIHHWRVDAMEDCPEDAALNRVREQCKNCNVERYSPRYFEDTWSKAISSAKKRAKKKVKTL